MEPGDDRSACAVWSDGRVQLVPRRSGDGAPERRPVGERGRRDQGLEHDREQDAARGEAEQATHGGEASLMDGHRTVTTLPVSARPSTSSRANRTPAGTAWPPWSPQSPATTCGPPACLPDTSSPTLPP